MTTHDDLLHAAALAQAEHPGELEYLFAEKMLAAVEPIIRADERERCGHAALVARDRTRWGSSDAWSRLDRLACDLFAAARIARGGDR